MSKPLTFLQDATQGDLLQAVATNHQHWMARNARAAGGAVYRQHGTMWVYQPGRIAEVTIAFPRLTQRSASAQIDAILQFCREHHPIHQVACWTLDLGQPPDLGARLVARGFQWGWQPHWMALDMQDMRPHLTVPAGLRIEQVEVQPDWNVDDLPYYLRELSAQPATWRGPQRVWHFGAWLGDQIAGHGMLNLTTGRLGVAGIFDIGVVPSARRQGIGAAVTWAACQHAQALGCRYAVLNATDMGEPVYRRLGFQLIGYGQTWWMREQSLEQETLRFAPPTEAQIAFVEAIGRGDVRTLDALGQHMTPAMLDAPILGRAMTLMELAVAMNQPAAIQWLLQKGASPLVPG